MLTGGTGKKAAASAIVCLVALPASCRSEAAAEPPLHGGTAWRGITGWCMASVVVSAGRGSRVALLMQSDDMSLLAGMPIKPACSLPSQNFPRLPEAAEGMPGVFAAPR